MRKFRTAVALAAVAGLGLFAAPATVSAGDSDPIATVAANNGFTVLVAALGAANLVSPFDDCSDGPYTVFAPTDEAFGEALAALGLTAEQLLANTELLTQILTYHVVEGEVPGAVAVTLTEAETLNGETLALMVSGSDLMINDATVVQGDVPACNGVIHVIDKVLVPPSLLPPTGSSSTTTSLMVVAGALMALGATGSVLVRRRTATVAAR